MTARLRGAGREQLATTPASYRKELEFFVRALRSQETVALPRDQIDLMRIIALAYQSAKERREIDA